MYFKEFREKLNLTQRQMYEKLGIAQNAIARYENGKVIPTISVVQKYIDELNANPNYLFLGLQPVCLSREDNTLSEENNELLKDLNLLLSQDQLNSKLSSILIEEVLNKFEDKSDMSLIGKFLQILKLEGHIPMRPFLFLYYIFRYILEHEHEIKDITLYREYIVDLVLRYKVFSIENNPVFTNRLKEDLKANLEFYLTEQECKLLITHPAETIQKLELKMKPAMIQSHRKINVQTLFPENEK